MRIISHIISVTRDRQIPTRRILLDLLHHTRQHTVSRSRELIRVSRKRDIPSHRHRRRLLILLRIRGTITCFDDTIQLQRGNFSVRKFCVIQNFVNGILNVRFFDYRDSNYSHARQE